MFFLSSLPVEIQSEFMLKTIHCDCFMKTHRKIMNHSFIKFFYHLHVL